MSMVSRWPVLVEVALEPHELDADRRLTTAGAERAFGRAREAYLARCRTIEGIAIECAECAVRIGGATVLGDAVTVVAAVIEIYPDAFTMRGRIRSRDRAGGDGDVAADVSCKLSTCDPLPEACVDEFIALAHSAPHVA
jgi:hypothetical protein